MLGLCLRTRLSLSRHQWWMVMRYKFNKFLFVILIDFMCIFFIYNLRDFSLTLILHGEYLIFLSLFPVVCWWACRATWKVHGTISLWEASGYYYYYFFPFIFSSLQIPHSVVCLNFFPLSRLIWIMSSCVMLGNINDWNM